MTTEQVGPASCPWCGLAKKVFVRAGSELVCTDCVEKDAAMDATWGDNTPAQVFYDVGERRGGD